MFINHRDVPLFIFPTSPQTSTGDSGTVCLCLCVYFCGSVCLPLALLLLHTVCMQMHRKLIELVYLAQFRMHKFER